MQQIEQDEAVAAARVHAVAIVWPAIGNPRGERIWRDVLVPIGHALLAELAEVNRGAVEAMRVGAPDMFHDPQLTQLIQRSTEANIQRVGEMLVQGTDPTGSDLPEETIAVVQSGVRMQIGLSPLLRLFTLAHELVWDWVFSRIVTATDAKRELSEASSMCSSWTFAFVDAATTRLAEAYDREREAWFSGALAERAETIEAILEGRERDEARASTRLKYDVRRHHLSLCAWLPDTGAPDPQRLLGSTVHQAATALGVQTSLVSAFGSHAARGWLSRSRAFTDEDLAALSAWSSPDGVAVAVGSPGSGLGGFRRSQLEAAAARRLALAHSAEGTSLTRYDDVAVAALSTVDREQAHTFVHRILGPLAAPDPTTRRIAETLDVLFAESGNRRRAGERLVVHANTVTYRVRQAETLLGRSLADAPLDVRLALTILPYLGDDA